MFGSDETTAAVDVSSTLASCSRDIRNIGCRVQTWEEESGRGLTLLARRSQHGDETLGSNRDNIFVSWTRSLYA